MRNKRDPNEIIICPDHAEIVLYDSKNFEKARALINLESVPIVIGTKWYQRPDGYVATNNYKSMGYSYLHAVLLGKGSGKSIYVDHRDGNRLNNTMANLRLATPSQNGMNKKIRSNNTSGRVGVHWSKTQNKWCAMICVKGKHVNLGYFHTIEEAIERRKKAETEMFGEFTPDERRLIV